MSEHPYSDVEREHNRDQVEKALTRRDRVLAHPDLAAYLTRPPLSLPDPLLWSGYIPPAIWREKHNDSPVRAQLVAIVKMVAEREQMIANRGITEGPDTGGRPPVAPELINEAQLTKLHTCLTEYGLTERPEKLLYLQAETGHPVASSKDLTKEEASQIIDTLDRLIRKEQAEQEARNAHETASQGDAGGDGGPASEPDPWGTAQPRDPWAEPEGGSGADFDPYAGEPPY